LVELFDCTKEEFDARLTGSRIRRIGREQWLRNLAVGLGNARFSTRMMGALQGRRDDVSPLVREPVRWVLPRHEEGV
jgi:epoxyqueuosine reductase